MTKITIKITSELKDKLALMSKIYANNKKAGAFPTAIMFDRRGFVHSWSVSDTLSYKLGAEELGLIPELPEEPIVLPDDAVRLIMSMPFDTTLDIEADSRSISIKARGKKSSCKFNAEGKEFPTIEEINPQDLNFAVIESSFLRKALEKCSFAMSTNKTKPIFTGLNFVCKDGILEAFAIDGFKIARSMIKSDGEFSFTVTREAVNILQNLLKSGANSKVQVGLNKTGRKAVFIADNQTVLRTSLLSGDIMDVNPFFEEHDKNIVVDSALLLGVLKQIGILSSKDRVAVVLEIKNDSMSLSYNSQTATYVDTVPIASSGIDSDSTERLGFDIGYLTECVKAIGNEKISFSIRNPLSPMVIRGDDEKKSETETVVVPMRLPE